MLYLYRRCGFGGPTTRASKIRWSANQSAHALIDPGFTGSLAASYSASYHSTRELGDDVSLIRFFEEALGCAVAGLGGSVRCTEPSEDVVVYPVSCEVPVVGRVPGDYDFGVTRIRRERLVELLLVPGVIGPWYWVHVSTELFFAIQSRTEAVADRLTFLTSMVRMKHTWNSGGNRFTYCMIGAMVLASTCSLSIDTVA